MLEENMGGKHSISKEAFVIHSIYPGLRITEFSSQKRIFEITLYNSLLLQMMALFQDSRIAVSKSYSVS